MARLRALVLRNSIGRRLRPASAQVQFLGTAKSLLVGGAAFILEEANLPHSNLDENRDFMRGVRPLLMTILCCLTIGTEVRAQDADVPSVALNLRPVSLPQSRLNWIRSTR